MSDGMAMFCVFIIVMSLLVVVLTLFFAIKKTIIEAIEIKEESLIKKFKKIQEIPKDNSMFFKYHGFVVYFIRFLKIHNLYGEYMKKFSISHKSRKDVLIYAELNPNDLCRYVSFGGNYNEWVLQDEIWRNIWANCYRGLDIKKLKYKDFYFRYLDKETFEKEKKLAKNVFYEHFLRRKKVE